jgi:GTP cyclohydrolase FolE2
MQKRSQLNIRLDSTIRNDIDLSARELGISVARYIVLIHQLSRTNYSMKQSLQKIKTTKAKEDR